MDVCGGAAVEMPVHRVAIAKPFAAGKFEVTFNEWDACVSYRGCTNKVQDGDGGRKTPPALGLELLAVVLARADELIE
jgi:formylglycine-generating enzyme required for sulfatase activity